MGAYDGKGKGFCNNLRCCTGQIKCSLGASNKPPSWLACNILPTNEGGQVGEGRLLMTVL